MLFCCGKGRYYQDNIIMYGRVGSPMVAGLCFTKEGTFAGSPTVADPKACVHYVLTYYNKHVRL